MTQPRAGMTFKWTINEKGFIAMPFDPREVFGKARVPVRVTVNGHTYRSTIAAMGGPAFVPLRRSHHQAAGVAAGQTVDVRIELDAQKREVKPPADLVKALKAAPPAWDRWRELSFTHQREHAEAVEGAKKPETRARRIARAVETIAAMKPKTRSTKA